MSSIPTVYLLVLGFINCCLATTLLATEQASQLFIHRNHANVLTGSRNQTYGNATDRLFSHATTQPSRYAVTSYSLSSHSRSEFIKGYEDFCVLWNSSCPGNSKNAFGQFEFYIGWNSGTMCNPVGACTVNEQSVPPASKAAFADIVDFARSGKCASMFGPVVTGEIGGFGAQYAQMGPCCGPCHFVPTIVDLYYWPQPNADTSCLDLIGDTVNPPDYGATTVVNEGSLTSTIWNCVTASRLINGTTSFGYLETASLTSVGSITYKKFDDNPWSPNPMCLITADGYTSSVSSETEVKRASIRSHPRALMVPRSIAHEDDTNSSSPLVVHQDNFAFTSPSLYVNFHQLQATDSCGPVGPSNGYTSTLVAFDPSELSTMLGGFYTINGQVRRLNVADLPCPPRSVMVEAWYTPARGQPYFPLLALPTKVQHLHPEWATCSDNFCPFTGYDPPRSLLPVAGMTPTTTIDPVVTSKQDPNDGDKPKNAVTSSSSTPVPAATPHVWNPTKTLAPFMIPSLISSPSHPSEEESSSDIHQAPGRQSSHDPAHLDSGQQASGGKGNDQNNHEIPSDTSGDYGQRPANAEQAPGGSNTEPISPQDGRYKSSAPKQSTPPISPLTIVTTLPDGTNVEALPGGRYVYKGNTLAPGAPPRSVLGDTVSLDISHELVISDHTYMLPPLPDVAKLSTTVFAGQTIAFEPNAVVVAGTTLTHGGPAKYLSGTKIILGSAALTIGTQILPIPSIFTHNPSGDMPSEHNPHALGGVLVDGTTLLSEGASMAIGGTMLSVDSTALVVGSMTLPFSSIGAMKKLQAVAGHSIDVLPYNLVSDYASYDAPLGTYLSHLPSTMLGYDQHTLDLNRGEIYGSVTAPEGAWSTITLADKTATLLPDAIAIDGTTLALGDLSNIQSVITLLSTKYAGSTTTIAEDSLTIVTNGVAIDGTVIHLSGPSISATGTSGTVNAAGQLGRPASTEPGYALGSLIMGGFGGKSTSDHVSPTALADWNSTLNSTFRMPAAQSRATQLDTAMSTVLQTFIIIAMWGSIFK